MKAKKINQLIAIHTLISACAGIALAVFLFIGFLKLEYTQQQISTEAVILNDVLRMEESFRQWLIMMDLVLGNEQGYLASGTNRQAAFFLKLLGDIGDNSLANNVQDEIQKISTLINSNTKKIDQMLMGGVIEDSAVTEFDEQSTLTLELLFGIKKAIRVQAQLNVDLLKQLREKTKLLSILSGIIFIVFIVAQWILLSLYLVRPVQKLSKAVALAQQKDHHFQYINNTGPVEIRGLAEDFRTSINKLEQFADIEQKANAAKSEFLSVMSHQIRTPLNAIIGFSEILKDSSLNQQQKEYINIVIHSGHSLLTLINDILDFSKIEAGKMELDLAWFDMYELLITTLSSNLHATSKKSLLLQHQINSNLPRYLYGDEQKLRQILYNLLNNAVKFTERGSISLNVNYQQNFLDDKNVIISVVDTGIGIAKDKQLSLFESFTQADASTTRKYGGTGLGLAIVSKMVALLRGDITIISEQGQGTEFLMKLPIATSAPKSDKTSIKRSTIAFVGYETNSSLVEQLKSIGYIVEPINVDDLKSSELVQSLDLAQQYQLILFSAEHTEQLLLWQQIISNGQKTPYAYCVENIENGAIAEELTEIPSIKVTQDGFDMVKQINRLIDSDLYMAGFDNIMEEINVLLVEDNPVNLQMAQNILKQLGLKWRSASNGQQAIELFKSEKFSLILMDCQMPVMDGFAATRHIRQLEKQDKYRIPIIALTANVFKEDREACFEAGMDDYLSKPFKKKQLLDIIKPWLKLDFQNNTELPEVDVQLNKDVLDVELFQELKDMDASGSNEFIIQMSQVFITNAEQLFQTMDAAFSEKSLSVVAKCAHQLKSSSMNVAAKSLSGLFEQLEIVANQNQYQSAVKIRESIIKEYRLVEKAYADFLENEIDHTENL